MPAILQTEAQLADRIEEVLNQTSDVVIDPALARKLQAQGIAKAFFDALVDRETSVTGASQTGGSVTGIGIIQ